MPGGAVFLSYASEDAAAAERIAFGLRAAGIEVWFDLQRTPNSEVELSAYSNSFIGTAWQPEEHMASAAERPVIMVLESDVIVRTEIAEFLRECGYKVIEGTTANDLWIIIDAKVKLDVVFSEVNLPGETDGFTVARRIRQTYPEIEVILTSSVEGAAEKSKDLCEEGPLKKPYRTQDVAARIHLLLERRRSATRKPP